MQGASPSCQHRVPKFTLGCLSIVFYLMLGFFLSPVRERRSESADPAGSKVLGVQFRQLWSRGGIPISPLALCWCCYSPWYWFWCFELCCELGHGKDPRQKRGRGEKRDFFVLFSSRTVCMLRIVLTQPRVVNRGAEVEATYTSFLVNAEIQCNFTLRPTELCFMHGQKLCKQTMASVQSFEM